MFPAVRLKMMLLPSGIVIGRTGFARTVTKATANGQLGQHLRTVGTKPANIRHTCVSGGDAYWMQFVQQRLPATMPPPVMHAGPGQRVPLQQAECLVQRQHV